jgi:hypothetical protein
MSRAWQICVYEKQQLVYSADIDGSAELGRQSKGEDGPYSRTQLGERHRLVIAPLEEDAISRKHALANRWRIQSPLCRPCDGSHLTTPLNHSNSYDTIYAPDLSVMTAGVHLGLWQNSTLTVGLASPVTGPRVFDVEAIAQLNWFF